MLEETDKIYCKGCGQELQPALSVKKALASVFAKQPKTYRFADGSYCQTCAKVKVAKQRKSIK